MRRSSVVLVAVLCVCVASGWASADVPLAQRTTWSGAVDFFATGAPMAIDGADVDTTMVDQLLPSATVTISPASVPGALVQAYLYWSGSITNNDCTSPSNIDDRVNFTPPGAAAATEVIATVCYCSDAAVTGYDIQVCRADVTAVIGAATTALSGSYVIEGFAARITNDSTDNASFSLVLVYTAPALPPRRIALYDGVLSMASTVSNLSLAGLDVDNPASGDLTWYTLEGDVGGSGTEQVRVSGSPGGASLVLSDPVNPAGNPMNHTINTVAPARTDTIGVDIDRFDLSAALTPGDTAVDMRYEAGTDKWWIAYNIVGVNVFEAVLGAASTKTSALQIDADSNAAVTPGDTVRYTIRLENTGTAPASVNVTDVIPAQAASWSLVSAGGGVNASTPTSLIVNNVPIAVGGSTSVVFDVVIADVPDNTMMLNTAAFSALPDGDAGMIVALPVLIRRDGDSDTVFDSSDNCAVVANTAQTNSDGDALGDACDACPMDSTNDADADTVCQNVDNCPGVANPAQQDANSNGVGDACELCADGDADAICDDDDVCVAMFDPAQADRDGDGAGDACDLCRDDPLNDVDRDRVCGNVDNCPEVFNPDELDGDSDGDGVGDACEPAVSVPDSGCGCASTGNGAGGMLVLLVAVACGLRRRSRARAM